MGSVLRMPAPRSRKRQMHNEPIVIQVKTRIRKRFANSGFVHLQEE
jgi:hypothetical protein